MSDILVDANEARLFLSALGEPPFTFQTIADKDKRRTGLNSQPPHYNGTLDEHLAALERMNSLGAGVYVMVNAGDGKGRYDENVVGIRAVFVDLDGSPLQPVLDAPLHPHIVVETSPGRYHAYWLVRDFPMDQYSRFQAALAQSYNGDNLKDLSRVLRMPGFYHRKGEPFQVSIHTVMENEPRYTFEEVLGLLTVPMEEPQAPPTERKPLAPVPAGTREARRRQSYILNMWNRELDAVANEVQGRRNARLFEATCNIAAFLHAGEYSEPEAKDALENAALRSGMTEKEDGIAATIASGMRKGKSNPREVPAAKDAPRSYEPQRYADDDEAPRYWEDVHPFDDCPPHDEPEAPEAWHAHEPTEQPTAPTDGAMSKPILTIYDGDGNVLDVKTQIPLQEHELKAWLTEKRAATWVFNRHGKDLRYVPGLGWRVWDGTSWRTDQDDLATRRRVQDIGDIIVGKYKALPDEARTNDGVHKAFHAYKKECEKTRTVDAIVKAMRSFPAVDATLTEWNADPYLLNLPNGVLDLRTAELREHSRDFYITQIGTTPYDPDADCPRWEQFINEIFQGDQELIAYMKWLCWYTLTGSTAHQFFCLLYGSGANGKSLFTSTLKYVMGREYGWSIEPSMLLAQAQLQHSTGFADLFGKRLVVASETPPNGRMDESAIKRLTGEDEITARKLYQDNIQFMPQCKLFICTNNKPRVADTSEGIWRRIQCVPFERQFKKEEQDPQLGAKLKAESRGILRWMVEGRRLVADIDRMPALPKAIAAASDEYRRDEDILGQFISECCTRAENCRVQSSKLYEAYKYWSGLKSLSNKTFTTDMKRKGFATIKSGGMIMWEKISLIETSSSEPRDYEDDYREERPFWDRD